MNGMQNPQHDPGQERRLLLVFVLTFAVLLISQPLLMKYIKPQQSPAPAQQPAAAQPAPAQTPTPPSAPVKAATPKAAGKENAVSKETAAGKQAAAEQETVTENDLYRITFTNRGAQVKSWVLTQFQDDQGRPLELVHQAAAQQYGYPLSLWTYDEGLRKKLAEALYVMTPGGTGGGDRERMKYTLSAPADITFDYSDSDTTVHKTFHVDHSYVVKIETSVTQNGQTVKALPAWPAGFG